MYCDCHIHMLLDGVYWKDAIARHEARPDEARIRQTLARYQSLGTAYLRDGGDRWGVGELAAKLAPEYGIRYVTPAFNICRAGHYGTFIGRAFSAFDEYRALLRELKRRGGNFVKLMISGIMDFSCYGLLTDEPMPPELIAAATSEAHELGFSVMVHANGDEAVSAAIDAGVDSVEHGAYLHDETVLKLSESGAVWVPTLVTIKNLIGCGRYPDEVLRPLFDDQCRAVRLAAAHGAYLAAGSDAGAYRVAHGQGMLDEYEIFRALFGAQAEEILHRGLARVQERF